MPLDGVTESVKRFLGVLFEIVGMILEITLELCVLSTNTGKEIVNIRL